MSVYSRFIGNQHPFSIPSMQWSQLPCSRSSLIPGPRRDATFVYDHSTQKILLFGGRTSDNVPLDDTWLLDITTSTWERIKSAPSRPYTPPARFAAIAGADNPSTSDRQGIIVALGMGSDNEVLGDVWGFHMTQLAWWPIHPRFDHRALRSSPALAFSVGGIAPDEPRQFPFMSTLVVSLGLTRDLVPSNLTYALTISGVAHSYNYSTVHARWSLVDFESSHSPEFRSHAAGTVMPGQKLFSFGGYVGDSTMSDAWIASPTGPSTRFVRGSNSWKRVDRCPAPRSGAAVANRPDLNANLYANQAVMFGGFPASVVDDPTSADGVVAYFDADSSSWIHVLPKTVANMLYPAQRSGAGFASHYDRGTAVLFGGQFADGVMSNDVWLLKFGAPEPAASHQFLNCSLSAFVSGGTDDHITSNSDDDEFFTGSELRGFVPSSHHRPCYSAILITFGLILVFIGTLLARFLKPQLKRSVYSSATRPSMIQSGWSPTQSTNLPSGPQTAPPFNTTESTSRKLCPAWLLTHIVLCIVGLTMIMIGFVISYVPGITNSDIFNYSTTMVEAGATVPETKEEQLIVTAHSISILISVVLLLLVTLSGSIQPGFLPNVTRANQNAQALRHTSDLHTAALHSRPTAAMDQALREANVDPNSFLVTSKHKNSGVHKRPISSIPVPSQTLAAVSYVRWWRVTHQVLGYLGIFLGFTSVLVGLATADLNGKVWFGVATVVLVLAFLIVILLSVMGLPSRRNQFVCWIRSLLGLCRHAPDQFSSHQVPPVALSSPMPAANPEPVLNINSHVSTNSFCTPHVQVCRSSPIHSTSPVSMNSILRQSTSLPHSMLGTNLNGVGCEDEIPSPIYVGSSPAPLNLESGVSASRDIVSTYAICPPNLVVTDPYNQETVLYSSANYHLRVINS